MRKLFVFDGLYPKWRYADEIEPLTASVMS